jgi:hypothetical protein
VKKQIGVQRVRDALAVGQVIAATNTPHGFNSSIELMADSSVALYQDFQAADPVDSIIARLMVGLSNMTMDALARAGRTKYLEERELEIKNATKGALVCGELAKAYDARRGRGNQTVNVGRVNVETGGQAVVGNVASVPRSQLPDAASEAQKQMEVIGNTAAERSQEVSRSESPSE